MQVSRGTRLVTGLAVAGALVASGCGSDNPRDEATAAPTSTDVPLPTGFDGCNLPQSVIDAEQLKKGREDSNWNTPGSSRKWLGCTWTQSDGFAAGITVTTITVQSIRESPSSQWTLGKQSTVAGRAAITYWQPSDDPAENCTINVEMKGGGMEIGITNPPSRRKSKGRNACDIATSMAGMLAPTIAARN
ncbi:DUF3558 domain-containing protein [Nocardia rhizosphaerihabitans]|uniref:DUF3558 domain-containing protein n=1 Tax=Nocardia rhizosphaerihabitans TaxID=1691570 RepID=UPI00366D2EA9